MLKKPVNIVLIDDEPESCKLLRNEAKKNRYIISSFHTLDDGIEYLENHQKVRAVILDSRCALDDKQDPNSIKTNFVFHAMDQINRIEHQQNRLIPFMVFADKVFDLQNDLEGIAKVITKQDGYAVLFQHLDQVISHLPEMVVRDKYAIIFEFIENYFSDQDDDIMETLLMEMEKSDPSSIVTNITIIRRLLEKLFDIAAPNLLGKNAEEFEQIGKSRTRNVIAAISFNKMMPAFLKKSANELYSFSSKYGNHNLTRRTGFYMPGNFAVISAAFTLLDLYIWFARKFEELSD